MAGEIGLLQAIAVRFPGGWYNHRQFLQAPRVWHACHSPSMTVPATPLPDGSPAPVSRPWMVGAVASILGIAGIAGSVFLARQQQASAAEVEKARFTLAATALTEALARRIDAYIEIAFGL